MKRIIEAPTETINNDENWGEDQKDTSFSYKDSKFCDKLSRFCIKSGWSPYAMRRLCQTW